MKDWKKALDLTGMYMVLQYNGTALDSKANSVAFQVQDLVNDKGSNGRSMPTSWQNIDSAAFVVFCKTFSKRSDKIVANSVIPVTNRLPLNAI